MNRWTICLVVSLFATSIHADEKFTPLFNGKDTTGWRMFLDPNAKGADAAKVWSVKEGVLICQGKPNGYIITEKEYENYVLRLQWRFPVGSPGGNSGVFVNVQGPDKIWPKGVEAQLF